MASSSMGFIDISYNTLPFSVDGKSIQTAFIPAAKAFEHDTWVVSGLRSAHDVMRGEETQLIGSVEPGDFVKNEIFIFPGTHSKHLVVKNNQVVDFKTYMTGEVFDLLVRQSILKNAVETPVDTLGAYDPKSFTSGVNAAKTANLLHAIFKVRTNQLFDVYNKTENFNYLSGLLIGAELNDLFDADAETINLVCEKKLGAYYHSALLALFPSSKIKIFQDRTADEAIIKGHLKIARQLKVFV
jgi:2-dehydro-3-deoxygalactonokinase